MLKSTSFDLPIPQNACQTIKIITNICSKFNCLKMDTFNVKYGFDYNQSICSTPYELLHIGLLSAIFFNIIKTRPISIAVITTKNKLIEIYFDQYEGFEIHTNDYILEFKTLAEFESKLRLVITS